MILPWRRSRSLCTGDRTSNVLGAERESPRPLLRQICPNARHDAADCFRNGGKGLTSRFAAGECSLGSVLVAASAKGVCAIFLGVGAPKAVRAIAQAHGSDRRAFSA